MTEQVADIPARYYARMGEVLLRAGVDLFSVLEKVGLDPQLLAQPDAMLRIDQIEAFVMAALQVSGRQDLALDTGYALHITSHSSVGYAMLSSPTAGQGMRLLARYFRLVMPAFSIRYRHDAEHIELVFEPARLMSKACLMFHLEAIVAATYIALGDLLGEHLQAYDVFLSMPKPAHIARYAEMRHVRLHFMEWWTAPGIRMRFAPEIMDRRPVLADPDAFRRAEERCRMLAVNVLASGKVAGWVAMMLRESTDGIPTLTELAQTLNLSTRTLDRYLTMEQTSFRKLYHQVRHVRAKELLANSHLTVTQVAYELGYTDLANFTRAFRKQEGKSPAEYKHVARKNDRLTRLESMVTT
ncbi:AraC family transcriptional regulator [Undibacterium rugosum]|uniref:AraC family transcriptional regulator n=1 Tax=Undibacterium rugosum TaxID=2762291 RepID=UPI001B8339F9|nr:AraC family transcriptional regulator [Undibacterium rugosum]MBR7776952.1 AraC family transcriptional regulator [Undibacterium rugosum]